MTHRLCALFMLSWVWISTVKADMTPHQVASYLAGVAQGLPAEQDTQWQDYAALLREKWDLIEGARFRPLGHWQSAQLPLEEGTLFYPMGGPDVIYPNLFFPKAKTYILVGLERVGRIASETDLNDPTKRASILNGVRQGTFSLFQRSFFVTKDMSTDYAAEGVTSSLQALLIKLGKHIDSVRYVQYTPAGTVVTTPADATPNGVEIVFTSPGSAQPQTLYYFRQNLNNGHLAPFTTFMEKHAPFALMIKSASYVPHQVGFENLTQFLLKHARLVLQDDTGLPYRFLKADNTWNIRLFGQYIRPYGSEFDPYVQKDLAAAYAEDGQAKGIKIESLPFRIGYGYSKVQSNMLLASRVTPTSTTSASAPDLSAQNGDKAQPESAN